MNAKKTTTRNFPKAGTHGYRSIISIADRGDLSITQITELNEIRERAMIGMCTQQDLARWEVLEPFQVGSTMRTDPTNGHWITTWWIEEATRFSAPTCPVAFPDEVTAQKVVNWLNYVSATKNLHR